MSNETSGTSLRKTNDTVPSAGQSGQLCHTNVVSFLRDTGLDRAAEPDAQVTRGVSLHDGDVVPQVLPTLATPTAGTTIQAGCHDQWDTRQPISGMFSALTCKEETNTPRRGHSPGEYDRNTRPILTKGHSIMGVSPKEGFLESTSGSRKGIVEGPASPTAGTSPQPMRGTLTHNSTMRLNPLVPEFVILLWGVIKEAQEGGGSTHTTVPPSAPLLLPYNRAGPEEAREPRDGDIIGNANAQTNTGPSEETVSTGGKEQLSSLFRHVDHGTPQEGTPLPDIPTEGQQHSPLHGVLDDIPTKVLPEEDQQIRAEVDIDKGGTD